MADMAYPIDISIVIPVRNGAEFIATQLDALIRQGSEAQFEIIVADNGSTDDTSKVAQEFGERDPRVRIVDASRGPGANVARNVGVAHARGRYILLTDADDVVHPGWVQAYWRAFTSGAQTVGGGLDRVLADGTLLASERKLYPNRMSLAPFANATNCGFAVEVFEAVDGFDESLIGTADEVDFFARTHRAGYKLTLVQAAVVDKLQHTDLSATFQQYFNFGRGEILLAKKFRPRMVSVPMTALAGGQAALWFLIWGTAGRVHRWRRKSVMMLALWLGTVVEGARALSE